MLNKIVEKTARVQTVPNDPMGVKMYELSNGLKLFLSINKNEPRIFTNIVVRAGSKYDPDDCTGLAHYLEHMMFKGNRNIGALDWERERILLEKIAELYEIHKFESDPDKRAELYREIDETSFEAARLVAANEYDKLASALGAKATNAYTWVEQTVYVNDIPSNELERWMRLESERFSSLALRLFHTELETVYEEFNISQDKDIRKALFALNRQLFPTHPYGTHTTIGEGEHLKSPSHRSIHRFFSTWYVPNNMGIVMAGDFDETEALRLAEKYWGSKMSAELPTPKFEPQQPFDAPRRTEVIGQEAEMLLMGWRLPKAADQRSVIAELVGAMMYNGQAGLIDIGLNNRQKVLKCQIWTQLHEDYSILMAYAQPRQGQTLEEVEQLILDQVEKLKKGDYPEWLPQAVITNLKLGEVKYLEKNDTRVAAITSAFTMGVDWEDWCSRFERMSKLGKDDIANFCEQHLGHHAAVYKRTGTDHAVMKVAKPPITAIELNREDMSEFTRSFLQVEPTPLQPEFIDFETAIEKIKAQNGLVINKIQGNIPGFFELHYIYEMGKLSDRKLGIAVTLLPYLGTERYSSVELQQEFFKLGLYFKVSCNDDRTYISLSGLEENLEAGMHLLEHVLQNARADADALKNVVDDAIKTFENNKKNREFILRTAMISYAKFGKNSPFTNELSENELRSLSGDELLTMVRQLREMEHEVLFVGKTELQKVARYCSDIHLVTVPLLPVKPPLKYTELESKQKVYFAHFPMVQADLMLISKGSTGFQLDEYLMAELYNGYFGYGLSSIFFQEIREARALGYAASAVYSSPAKNERSHYLQAYVGTQPDKIQDALPAMKSILENMPMSLHQLEQTRISIIKRIESERIRGSHVFWKYLGNLKRGYNHDIRRDLYLKMQDFQPEQLQAFHEANIKERHYTLLVLGNRENIDPEYLKKWGEFTELTYEDLFGEG